MATEADHVAAVIADPDDDSPRLIYADWLDEQGQSERAEFIRVQCELARPCKFQVSPPETCLGHACEYCSALRRRKTELLHADYPLGGGCNGWFWAKASIHEHILLEADSHRVGADNPRPVFFDWFRRGFVEAVTCTTADWLAHGDAVLKAQPVREVTLTTWPEVEDDHLHRGYRLAGRTWWTLKDLGFPNGAGGGVPYTEEERNEPADVAIRRCLLAAEWPYVKTWHIPPRFTFRLLAWALGLKPPIVLTPNEVRTLRGRAPYRQESA